jgi:hypothetical protein
MEPMNGRGDYPELVAAGKHFSRHIAVSGRRRKAAALGPPPTGANMLQKRSGAKAALPGPPSPVANRSTLVDENKEVTSSPAGVGIDVRGGAHPGARLLGSKDGLQAQLERPTPAVEMMMHKVVEERSEDAVKCKDGGGTECEADGGGTTLPLLQNPDDNELIFMHNSLVQGLHDGILTPTEFEEAAYREIS